MHKGLGLERIQVRLHRGPPHQGADHPVEDRHDVFHRHLHFLLRQRIFDVGINLLFLQELEVIEPDQWLGDRAFGIAPIDCGAQRLGKYLVEPVRVAVQVFHYSLGASNRIQCMGLDLGGLQQRFQTGQDIGCYGIALGQNSFKAALQCGLQSDRIICHSQSP